MNPLKHPVMNPSVDFHRSIAEDMCIPHPSNLNRSQRRLAARMKRQNRTPMQRHQDNLRNKAKF